MQESSPSIATPSSLSPIRPLGALAELLLHAPTNGALIMSIGCNNIAKDSIESSEGGANFASAISRIAVTQIYNNAGFQGSRRSALDALADVAVHYICDLGRVAHFYAGQSGRTDCNVFDIIQGLEDFSFCQGFNSASKVHGCLVSSGVVRDISRYVSSVEEVPFACPIPRFPIVRSVNLTPSFAAIGEAPDGKHMPDWLPAFPDTHTYIHTPVWRERMNDSRTEKMEQARQQRKAERSLLTLQKRLACNGATGLQRVDLPVNGDASKGKQVACSNPFLAPPFLCGEREVSEIMVQDETAARSTLPVLETFAPAIVAAKTRFFDTGTSDGMITRERRPKVNFKFGITKKLVSVPPAASALSIKKVPFHLREDEKDDKKRRVEMILQESMNNPEELSQL